MPRAALLITAGLVLALVVGVVHGWTRDTNDAAGREQAATHSGDAGEADTPRPANQQPAGAASSPFGSHDDETSAAAVGEQTTTRDRAHTDDGPVEPETSPVPADQQLPTPHAETVERLAAALVTAEATGQPNQAIPDEWVDPDARACCADVEIHNVVAAQTDQADTAVAVVTWHAQHRASGEPTDQRTTRLRFTREDEGWGPRAIDSDNERTQQ